MSTTTAHFRLLQTLFEQAVALPPAERDAFLAERCGDDEPLRERLRHMLASDHDRGVLDDAPVPVTRSNRQAAAALQAFSLVGRRIGSYEILRVIASGGMGTVYEAQQAHPSRRVALKVMSGSLAFASPEALRRFEFEAELLARLQHPAIAAIYESGVFVDDSVAASPLGHHGRPFFAMELIGSEQAPALSITQFAQARGLDIRERVQLLIRVCEGVEHAHSRGVIHRDLKPMNILVCDAAAQGVEAVGLLKILDFGIARAADADRGMMQITSAGEVLGTLAYMSPEQAAGGDSQRRGGVDVRSDVYALGVIAYELLGGRTPHDLTRMSMAGAARVILEREPRRLGALERRCRGDLETIVATALEKDPDRRYQSASQLAEDLRRYLADEPIAARRASRLYQLRKFALRNRTLVAGMLGVFVALALGVIGTAWQWARAIDQRDRAMDAEQRATMNLREAAAATYSMHEFAEQYLSNIAGAASARLHLAQQALEQQRQLPNETAEERMGASYAYQRVGDVQLVLGRSREALAMYQITLELRQAAVRAEPANPAFVRTLAVGHFKMFDALHRMGRFAESAAHAQQSVDCLRDYAELRDQPLSKYEEGYVSFAHRRLGDAVLALGRAEEAIEHCRTSLDYVDPISLGDDEAADRNRARGAALAQRGWGEALASLGRHAEALEKFHASLSVLEPLSREVGPMNVWERATASRVLASIAGMHGELGQVDLALECARRAVDIAQALAEGDRENIESQYAHAHALLALAKAQRQAGLDAEAEMTARPAREILTTITALDADFAPAQRDLAEARVASDDSDGAS